jgi:hypothetical protein
MSNTVPVETWGAVSPDADRIARLPHARHPALVDTVRHYAADPRVSFSDALDALEIARAAAGVSILDLEMLDPANAATVPFAPSRNMTEGENFQEAVSAHVARQLGGVKR